MLTQLDDGFEITAEPGRGRVRLRAVERPWNDEVLDFLCEIEDAGISATGAIRTLGGDSLPAWTAELAESYVGWDGVRSWRSLEHDLRIDATHDRRGHVSLRFAVRGPRGYEADAWEASACVQLDAGEDTKRFAAEVATFLA
ncbi:DUF6228 family protein [Actinoplanes sp. NEAU-A12]|uniref:DUF6228 family protein n=1 Tax=Actinoplanes sandaracinus TaxID=3045177 RepID=A0ABT6X0S6_9ACTN|nr:DUF6228 family protein [Actinoplanes sandaracinus]MDI6105593.1 DUF6228 family protein [Actinoplanes sandaracinus]